MSTFVYIDGANFYQATKELGCVVDYKKFRGWLGQKFGVTKAYIFIGFMLGREDLYAHLTSCGFVLIFKPVLRLQSGHVKGNCDAELVLRIISDYYEKTCSSAALITGDGDFACVIDFFQKRGFPISLQIPRAEKCSVLLKRTGVRLYRLEEHYQKFSHFVQKEKAPDTDASV